MRSNVVLIDFESVQPGSLEALEKDHYRVVIFVGATQAKLPTTATPLANNPNLPAGERRRVGWFNTAAFARTPLGSFGNAGVGILRGPGTIAVAGGLFKSFSVTERLRLRLEATFTNLPNHPNFSLPENNVNVSAGATINRAKNNRNMQMGLRLEF